MDVEGVLDRLDMFTRTWDHTFLASVDIVRGRGRIAGARKVSVQEHNKDERTELQARYAVVLATGSDRIMADIPGLMESKPWKPREAASAT